MLPALLCLLPLLAEAVDFPPAGFVEVSSEKSPLDAFKVIHFKRDPEDFSSDSQIWLQALKPPFKTQLLFSHNNRASWLISGNEEFIAINHHALSDLGLLHVFAQGKDGAFHKIEKEFGEVARKLMTSQLKLAEEPGFDHEYCYADAWLRDGLLLAHLEGHESGVHFLKEWYFLYDAKGDRFSWDLSRINEGAFGLVKHGN